MGVAEQFLKGMRRGGGARRTLLQPLSHSEFAEFARSTRPKGALEHIFDYLDRPGQTIRALLAGEPGDALRAAGSFALPGIVDAPEERYDLGFIGNLATDPLMYITGGGAGALKGIKAATATAKGAKRGYGITRLVGAAAAKHATKAGRAKYGELLDILTRRAAPKAVAGRGPAMRFAQMPKAREAIAFGKRLQRDPEFVKQLMREGMLESGGLKFGLPFREGRTIARAGKKTSLLHGNAYYLAAAGVGKALKPFASKVKWMREAAEVPKNFMRALYPGYGMTNAGNMVRHTRDVQARGLVSEAVEELRPLTKGWSKDANRDFAKVLTGNMDEAAFVAAHGIDPGPMKEWWGTWAGRMREDLIDRGIWDERAFGRELDRADAIRTAAATKASKSAAALEPKAERVFKSAERERSRAFAAADTLEQNAQELRRLADQEVRKWMLKADEAAHGRTPLELIEEGRPAVPGGRAADPDLAKQHRAKASAIREKAAKKYLEMERRAKRLRDRAERTYNKTLTKAQRVEARAQTQIGKQQLRDTAQAARIEVATPDALQGMYFPQQWSDEVTEALERAQFEAWQNNLQLGEPIAKEAGPFGASTRSQFAGTRKYRTSEEFREGIDEMVLKATGRDVGQAQKFDFVETALKRISSHARQVANFDMLETARRYGLAGTRKLKTGETAVDAVFGDWLRAGAGQLKRRTGVSRIIELWNRHLFKPYVTVGLGPIVNPAFVVRNYVSGMWQAAAHPHIGAASGGRHLVEGIYNTIAKVSNKIPGLPKIKPTTMLRIIKGEVLDQPMKIWGKVQPFSERQFRDWLLEFGVTRNNFSRFELGDLQRVVLESKGKGLGTKAWNWLKKNRDFAARVTESAEDMMRTHGFAQALSKGLSPADAAKVVRDAFIDYEMVSGLHRGIRDVIPFAQFTIGQTPRTLKTILERPRVLAPLRAAKPGRDELVPPWIAEQPFFPAGTDREGNKSYLVGASTPFEDINKFYAGGLGRSLERGFFGSLTPPLKYGYERASGREPFFGSEVGTYRRENALTKQLPDWLVGRKRITRTDRKTGEKTTTTEVDAKFHRTMQYLPLSRQIGMVNQLFDTRQDVWKRWVNLLTGVKVRSVDEEREIRKLIAGYLEEQALKGDVGVIRKFFARDGDVDPMLARLIKSYYASLKGK